MKFFRQNLTKDQTTCFNLLGGECLFLDVKWNLRQKKFIIYKLQAYMVTYPIPVS